MRNAKVRILLIAVAILLVGAAAIVVALVGQASRSSQIPTVTTNPTTGSPAAASHAATSTGMATVSVVETAVPAPATVASSASERVKGAAAKADREVVTPVVRDDQDAENQTSGGSDRTDQSIVPVARVSVMRTIESTATSMSVQ